MPDDKTKEPEVYIHGVYSPDIELFGLLPGWLDPNDERSARDQFNANLQMGWHDEPKFTVTQETPYSVRMRYEEGEDDPDMISVAWMRFRGEMIYRSDYEHIALKHEGKWEVCRCD